MADSSKKDLMDSLGDFVPEGAKRFGRNVNALRDVAYHVAGKPVLDSFDSIARAIHHITQAPNEDELYGRTYNLLRKHGHDQEAAADFADKYAQQRIIHGMPLQLLGSMAADTIQRYVKPEDQQTGSANAVNDVLTGMSLPGIAAGAVNTLVSTPANSGEDEVARQMRMGLRQSPQGMAETPVAEDKSEGYDNGGTVDAALKIARGYDNGGMADDVVQKSKQIIASPMPNMSKGQQQLIKSFQSENKPAAVVSPKPGTGSTENSPGWSFATPNLIGSDQPPPMQAPTHNAPRLHNIAAHVQKQMKTKGFQDLVRDVAGIHRMDVTPTTGSWLGKVEPSFIINGYGQNGEEATPAQIRKLSHLLGFGYQQDAVVEHHHNPNIQEGIPTLYIGKKAKLSQNDLDAIHSASQEHGLDFTRTKDGRGVKFSHFGDEKDTPEQAEQNYQNFLQKVAKVADKTKMPDRLHVRTTGDLKYAKGYLDEIFGGNGSENGVSSGSTRSPDLFRRVVNHVLAPYAKAAAAEGYRLSPERLGQAYGLTEDEVAHVRNALYPGAKDERSSVPLMEGKERLDVRPTGARGEANVDDVIDALQNRAASRGQVDPNDFSDKAKQTIAKSIADEVNYHVNNSEKSAIGWYDNALRKAKGEYHKIFPEIANDPQKEQLFNSILGITSQGADVHTNSKNAARVYDMVRNGKSISDAVNALKGTFGKETRAIEFNLKKYENLLNKLGPDRMQSLFNQKMPKKDWDKFIKDNDFMVDHNGTPLSTKGGANQKITGWSVFGPKIGSFMNNLNGDYSTLTADLWFTRTWNRLMGHSFLHQPTQEAKNYRDFKDALRAEYYKDTGPLTPLGKRVIPTGKTVMGQTKFSKETGEPAEWLHGNDAKELSHEDFQKLMNNPDDLLNYAQDIHTKYVKSGYKDKSDLRRRAKNWIENRYNSAAAPRGDKERNFQQDTVEEAQKMLKKRYGLNVSVADIQAALWFHEKELFGKYGVASERAEPADYYDAAHQTVADHKSGNLYKTISADRAASKMAAKETEDEISRATGGRVGYADGGVPVRTGEAALGSGPVIKQTEKSAQRAFHVTMEPFENYDWSKLGKSTAENSIGGLEGEWALNLAKIGPWAHETDLTKKIGGTSIPVDILGAPKSFKSLNALEAAVRKAGGPEAFRENMTRQGFGHIKVNDQEFGGKSFIALQPDKFKVVNGLKRAWGGRVGYADGGAPDINDPNSPEEKLKKLAAGNTMGLDGTSGNITPGYTKSDTTPDTANQNTGNGILGGIFGGGAGATPNAPAAPASNDLNPYNNANYQPGAVQSYNLPNNDLVPYNNANYQPGAVQSTALAPPATAQTTAATTPTANVNVATATPSQMFSDSGKITSRAGEELPGYLGPERSAFVDESKALAAAYGNLADTFAANQAATPTAAEVGQNLPGAVTGQNLVGSFDPLASQDVLGDVSHGTFGLAGPMGLSNAIQETQDQIDQQQEENPESAPEDAPPSNDAPENNDAPAGDAPAGDGPEGERRGGFIHPHHRHRMPLFAHGGYVYDDLIRHALRVAHQFGPDAAQRAVQIALQQAGRR